MGYGQIFGSSKYQELDTWHKKSTDKSQSLKVTHAAKFGQELLEENFNRRQVFVVMTNGLDRRTREAVQYWRSCGLDVRPWVYRVYRGDADEMLLEISPFRVADNPYDDIAEGYYVLNTNFSNNEQDHHDMIASGKAAAYFDPWKFKIKRLSKGDVVFLYQSGVGVVAVGSADGKLLKAQYQGNPEHPEEEYSMKLLQFQLVSPPITAAEIKKITGTNHRFMSTIFGLDADRRGTLSRANQRLLRTKGIGFDRLCGLLPGVYPAARSVGIGSCRTAVSDPEIHGNRGPASGRIRRGPVR